MLEPGSVSADERFQRPSRARVDARGPSGAAFARAELAPGDVLYMPRGWWHEVDSEGSTADGVSCAVNWYFG